MLAAPEKSDLQSKRHSTSATSVATSEEEQTSSRIVLQLKRGAALI